MASVTSQNPRWKQLLAENIGKHIKDEKSLLYYALSTVAPSTAGKAAVPQVRYVVHRGFVNEKRDGDAPGGVAPQNPDFGSSPCLMTTTDIRTPKVQQLTKQAELRGKEADMEPLGGESEIAWWMESAQLQARAIHVLPRSDHPLRSLFPYERLAPPPASSDSSPSAPFDWDNERMRIFNKLNPGLLASFARPTPSSDHPNASKLADAKPKDDLSSPWPLELPQPGKEENEEQKKLLAESEHNFALLVLEPRRVDLVDLGNDQRTIFELKDGQTAAKGEWSERRVVP